MSCIAIFNSSIGDEINLAIGRGISVAVFLKYTSLFTVINCIGSLILVYGVMGDNKRHLPEWVFCLPMQIKKAYKELILNLKGVDILIIDKI